MIEVRNVSKHYVTKNRKEKKTVFHTYEKKLIKAVDNISFSINEGEIIGYIGKNGAGKSTTIKMLCGIISPTSGDIQVMNINPTCQRKKYAYQVGAVFGNRSQLIWDLPVIDSLELYKIMYKMDDALYKKNLDIIINSFDLSGILDIPARLLSLGQRIKANIALSIIYDPKILFLDEPTIGLDIITKDSVCNYLKEINKLKNTTIILTTHDLQDIDKICNRIIMIDNGKIIYDGLKNDFTIQFSQEFRVELIFENEDDNLEDTRFQLEKKEGRKKTYLINKNEMSKIEAMQYISTNCYINDVSIYESSIEDVVRNYYKNN